MTIATMIFIEVIQLDFFISGEMGVERLKTKERKYSTLFLSLKRIKNNVWNNAHMTNNRYVKTNINVKKRFSFQLLVG